MTGAFRVFLPVWRVADRSGDVALVRRNPHAEITWGRLTGDVPGLRPAYLDGVSWSPRLARAFRLTSTNRGLRLRVSAGLGPASPTRGDCAAIAPRPPRPRQSERQIRCGHGVDMAV